MTEKEDRELDLRCLAPTTVEDISKKRYSNENVSQQEIHELPYTPSASPACKSAGLRNCTDLLGTVILQRATWTPMPTVKCLLHGIHKACRQEGVNGKVQPSKQFDCSPHLQEDRYTEGLPGLGAGVGI